MVSDAIYTYDITIFTASVAIAIIVSFVAIYIFSTLQHLMKNRLLKMFTSLVMGLAISSMHYTGLMGTTYYIHRDKIDSLHESSSNEYELSKHISFNWFGFVAALITVVEFYRPVY